MSYYEELGFMMSDSDPLEGLWQGFEGEWGYVSRHLTALAEAFPPSLFGWRPVPGVRSISEVLMHVALANFYLLSMTGPALPTDLASIELETSVTEKGQVIGWLTRALDAVRAGYAAVTPDDFQRKVKILGRDATVDGTYLRILVHANEHMGQLTAYARMANVAPPWTR